MIRIWILLAITVPSFILSPTVGHSAPCGLQSIIDLCHVLDYDLSTDSIVALAAESASDDEGMSMAAVTEIAEQIGLDLIGVRATLDQQVDIPGPKIVNLSRPGHFAVLVRASTDEVQLLESGMIDIWTRDDFEERFDGYMLVPARALAVRGEPRPQLSAISCDLGVVPRDETVTCRFDISNSGDAELVVKPQQRSCGGPKCSIESEHLLPGETTELTVELRAYSGGRFRWTVPLATNASCEPFVYLLVTGSVVHEIRATPPSLVLARGTAREQAFLLLTGPADACMTRLSSERGFIGARLLSHETDWSGRETWHISVMPLLAAGAPVRNRLYDRLIIEMNDSEQSQVVVPVIVKCLNVLSVEPECLFAGFVSPGRGIQDTVDIQSRTPSDFTVLSAVADSDRVTVGAPEKRDEGWAIPISVDTSQPGVVDAILTVTTDVPGEETLQIPVYAHILADGQGGL